MSFDKTMKNNLEYESRSVVLSVFQFKFVDVNEEIDNKQVLIRQRFFIGFVNLTT
jgi:hypothetical protein